MTWKEIKKAIEDAGVEESDEICLVQCEWHNGSKTFHKSKMGKAFKFSEQHADNAAETHGCAS